MDYMELLRDKTTWKICESVKLGLDSIYLTFFRIRNAAEEFDRGRAEGMYTAFEKAGQTCYKYILSDGLVRDYRENVLPNLPPYWWTDTQPWMPEVMK